MMEWGITRLTPLVTRISSPPFGTGSQYLTNAYLVGKGIDRLLIDSGSGHPDGVYQLAEHLRSNGLNICKLLITSNNLNYSSIQHLAPHSSGIGDGKTIKHEGFTIQELSTPGYIKEHNSYWLQDEEILFSGCSIVSRPGSHPAVNHVFSNLRQFRESLSKQHRIFPKLIFPLHGDVSIGVSQIETLQSTIEFTIDQMRRVISNGTIITGSLVDNYVQMHGIKDTLDIQIANGNIRAYLKYLEETKVIKRANAVNTPSSSSGASIKGPGGLTMEQIFAQVQKSRADDFRKGVKGIDFRLHPLHESIQINSKIAWKLCK